MIKSSPSQQTSRESSKEASEHASVFQQDAGSQSLDALIARAFVDAGVEDEQGKPRALPPVERWNPDFCGDIDMEIRADGTWFYMGTPIGRPTLVRLFSTILRRDEDGRTYLVTPVEKVGIRVADAPFLAVEMQVVGEGESQVLTFRTNVGDVVTAGPANPLRFEIEPESGGLKPYIRVRGRLEALITRAVMYELVALGEDMSMDDETMFGVRSQGMAFPMMRSDDLQAASF